VRRAVAVEHGLVTQAGFAPGEHVLWIGLDRPYAPLFEVQATAGGEQVTVVIPDDD